MRSRLHFSAAALGYLSVVGCSNSFAAPASPGDPLERVTYTPVILVGQESQSVLGQYFPGTFPSNLGGPDVSADFSSPNLNLPAGVGNQKFSGYAALGSTAVAFGFQNIGKGYWIVPPGLAASGTPGYLSFDAAFDFARSIPLGPQPLLFAACDASGHFGASRVASYAFTPTIPAGHAVASLTWGNNADLDLHLVSPSGVEVYPKNPNSVGVVDAGADAGQELPGNGRLDRDSNANCFADTLRAENVVWKDSLPEAGTYLVRVDMFNACGTPAADFKFTLYVEGAPVLIQNGQLLDINADGGGPGSGLYIGKFTCDGSGKCS